VIPLDLLKRATPVLPVRPRPVPRQVETAGILTVLHEEDHSLDESTPYMRKLMSVGKEAIGGEVRVVDEDGREIAPNEVGEIVARGPNVFEGVLERPGLTAKVLRDGWLRDGDVASVDEERGTSTSSTGNGTR